MRRVWPPPVSAAPSVTKPLPLRTFRVHTPQTFFITLLGQWQPLEVAVLDEGMKMILNLTRDSGRVDIETEFYVPHHRRLGEICGRHQSFTPIDYDTFRVQRTAHGPGRR